MKAVIVMLLMLSFPLAYQAQYNSDYREVKRKKIKSVTALHIEGGDTTFTRYSYDRMGRITSEERWLWFENIVRHTYDEWGNVTSSLELKPNLNMQLWYADPKEARRIVTYDTVEWYVRAYFGPDEDWKYLMNRHYNDKGKCVSSTLSYYSDDTIFGYEYDSTGLVLWQELRILYKVDSIKRGYAEVSYDIESADTLYHSCLIRVLDKNGSWIREYYVHQEDSNKRIVNKYNPIGDTSINLVLYSWYNKKTREMAFLDWKTHEYRISVQGEPVAWTFNSLEQINGYGTVFYEYYE